MRCLAIVWVLAVVWVFGGCRLGFDHVLSDGALDGRDASANACSIASCASGDGCCPIGCNTASDSDCASGTLLDLFDATSYTGNNGSRDWATEWIEVGDDGSPTPMTPANIFVESHVQNPTANTPALKVKVAASGQYVYREANLAGATSATLSYRFRNELLSDGRVEIQVSPDGGGAWTTLRNYTVADVLSSESIPITSHATANTRIRIIATAVGTRHFRIDDVEIAFSLP